MKAAGLGDIPVKRVLTALVLTPFAVIAVLWLPEVYFAAFGGLVVLVGASEWLRLSGVVDSSATFFSTRFGRGAAPVRGSYRGISGTALADLGRVLVVGRGRRVDLDSTAYRA